MIFLQHASQMPGACSVLICESASPWLSSRRFCFLRRCLKPFDDLANFAAEQPQGAADWAVSGSWLMECLYFLFFLFLTLNLVSPGVQVKNGGCSCQQSYVWPLKVMCMDRIAVAEFVT